MIVDTSALAAILLNEADAPHFARLLDADPAPAMSAANYLELCVVIDGRGDALASRRVDELIAAAGIIIEPVTEAQARIARQAYRDFGRGTGHPARLNLGDCFAYALASERRDALLFKGEDFVHTDLRDASRSSGGPAVA